MTKKYQSSKNDFLLYKILLMNLRLGTSYPLVLFDLRKGWKKSKNKGKFIVYNRFETHRQIKWKRIYYIYMDLSINKLFFLKIL